MEIKTPIRFVIRGTAKVLTPEQNKLYQEMCDAQSRTLTDGEVLEQLEKKEKLCPKLPQDS